MKEGAATTAAAPSGEPSPAADWIGPWATSALPVYCRDAEGLLLASNLAFDRKFERNGQSMLGISVEQLIHPDDRAAYRQANNRPGRLTPESGRTFRWQTSHGWRWFASEETALFDSGDRQVATRAVCRDVTRQRLAEELYIKLSRAVDQSPVAIAITDAEGRIQYVNPKFVHATGHSLEDILERKVEVLRDGHGSEESYQRFWATVRAGGEWRGEVSRARPDGTVLWESVHVSCMRNPAGEITNLLCLREDITERRRLQDELRQAQKMDSLGTLAGGVAHDFNNLLAVVTGYADIAALNPGDPAILQKSLREIVRAAQRAGGLVRQILTFSRKAEVRFAPMDLNLLVRDLVALFSETFPRMVKFQVDLQERLPALLADHNQLQQVILNLCVNARDAMPQGGTLSVRTAICARGESRNPLANSKQAYARLQIGDTGIGMTAEVRHRIFEPFFTTKEANQGTGLGLAVVYGIVASHGGFIEVESSPGAGSSFHIYLPLAENTQVTAAPSATGDFPGGTEAVLVVDDEDPLLQLLEMALTAKGYRVTCAGNGLDAMDIVSDRARPLHAVLLDLNMPGATGLEVLKFIKATRPELKVVVLSGDLKPEARAEIDRLGEDCFIRKPYALDDLGRRLRRVLGS